MENTEKKKSKVPIVIAIVAVVVVVLIIVGIFGQPQDEGGTSTSSQPSTPVQSQQQSADGEGDIGNAHIKIVSARVGETISGNDAIIVTYEWTNNGDENLMFSLACEDKAFQNGVECSVTTVDGVNIISPTQEIQPGATQTLEIAYALSDKSDVTIELNPWSAFGADTKITKVFSVE